MPTEIKSLPMHGRIGFLNSSSSLAVFRTVEHYISIQDSKNMDKYIHENMSPSLLQKRELHFLYEE